MLTLIAQDQPHRAFTHFRGKPVRRLAHDAPSYSRVGASGKPGAVQKSDLGATWRSLWQQVLGTGDKSVQPAVRRFVYFLDRLGIDPSDVCDDHALAFKKAIEDQEISRSPETTYRAAVNGWNLAQSRFEFWPKQRLTLPSRLRVIQLAPGILPDNFSAEVEAYLARLGAPDPFATEGPTRALRPDTIVQYRRLLLRFAAHMVASGTDPSDIDGLMALLEPARVERTLRRMLEQNGQKTSETVSSTAGLLSSIAKRMSAPDAWQLTLSKMAKRVALPRQDAMTQKNRIRLRPLQNDKNLLRLLDLPGQLFSRKRGVNAPHRDALAREDAVAIAILIHCPYRVKNLARINLELNLHRPGDGSAYLVFESDVVKNYRPVEFQLPKEVIELIDAHLRQRVPTLCPAGTPWLFPKRDGSGHIGRSELSSRIAKRIHKETRLKVNSHLFRHLAAMLYLEARPGAYEAAGRLLGHSNTSRTIRVYSGMETRTATQVYSELVLAKKRRT
jgi:integrase